MSHEMISKYMGECICSWCDCLSFALAAMVAEDRRIHKVIAPERERERERKKRNRKEKEREEKKK